MRFFLSSSSFSEYFRIWKYKKTPEFPFKPLFWNPSLNTCLENVWNPENLKISRQSHDRSTKLLIDYKENHLSFINTITNLKTSIALQMVPINPPISSSFFTNSSLCQYGRKSSIFFAKAWRTEWSRTQKRTFQALSNQKLI